MGYLIEIIRQHMGILFFIYGAAFFLFGSLIIIQSDANSKFTIGRYFWLLGIFGVLHGFNEWIDMLLVLHKTSDWVPAAIGIVFFVRNIFTYASFIFLLQFGVWSLVLVYDCHKLCRWVAYALLSLSILFVGILMMLPLFGFYHVLARHQEYFKVGEILARYFIGFPGALLTGISLLVWQRKPEIRDIQSTMINVGFMVVGITFIVYAILAGLIVPAGDFYPASVINYDVFARYVGFPVQFFRTLCAIIVFIFMFCVLHIFNVEKYKYFEE
ncbi:MAG: hypothetical protein AABY34_06575 [Pseudomonadota bacterium]